MRAAISGHDLTIAKNRESDIQCAGNAPQDFVRYPVFFPEDAVENAFPKCPAIDGESLPHEGERARKLYLLGAEWRIVKAIGDLLHAELAGHELVLQIGQCGGGGKIGRRIDPCAHKQPIQLREGERVRSADIRFKRAIELKPVAQPTRISQQEFQRHCAGKFAQSIRAADGTVRHAGVTKVGQTTPNHGAKITRQRGGVDVVTTHRELREVDRAVFAEQVQRGRLKGIDGIQCRCHARVLSERSKIVRASYQGPRHREEIVGIENAIRHGRASRLRPKRGNLIRHRNDQIGQSRMKPRFLDLREHRDE